MKGLICGLSVIAAMACGGAAHAFSDSDCLRIVPGSYQVSEEFRASEPMAAVRQRALQQLTESAIANVIGVRVKSQRGSDDKAENNRIEERFHQKIMAQSQGLVHYNVSNENVSERDGRRILEIKATADVCVPNPSALKDVVVIKEALSSRNEPLAEFRTALVQVFNASPYFTVASEADGFEDADVSARVVEVDVRDIEAPADSLTAGADQSVKRKFKRIRAVIIAEAKYHDDDALRVMLDDFRTVPTDRDPLDAINLFIPAQLQRVAGMLVEKMTAARDKKSSPQTKAPGNQEIKSTTLAVFPALLNSTAQELINKDIIEIDVQEMTRQLEEGVRATRRFTMFERSAEILAKSVFREQDFAQGGRALADAAEWGKLNNVRSIVQPLITTVSLKVARKPLEEFPGKFRYVPTGAVSVTVKMLDTTTGEITFQTTQDATLSPGSEVGKTMTGPDDKAIVTADAWRVMAKDAAIKLTNAIVDERFPIQVMQTQADDIFVNRGEGGGIVVGDIYQLVSVGESLIDPATKENLGSAEATLGEVQVTRVNPRFSIVKAITLLAGRVKAGDILRRRSR
jgi:hypothetical protein